MQLEPDHEAQLVRAIRRCPSSDADKAWAYAASRLRPLLSPTMRDIDEIGAEIIGRYGGFEEVKESRHG
jgi:hypothetical protein